MLLMFSIGSSSFHPLESFKLTSLFNSSFSFFDLIVLLLTYSVTFVVGPDIYSRIFCAKNEKTAARSILLVAFLLIPISFILTWLGIYSGNISNSGIVSFAEHLLFKLIDEEEFLEIYHPFQHLVRHDCVLIAERDHEPIGFAFAIPDLLQANRGEMNDTLIIKALAVLPNRLYAGLGYFLLDQIRLVARQHGYTRLIHALMHDAGYMRRRISNVAKPIRRYALFSKELRS